MANIYVKEPPTSGKIRLVTSKGNVDIELWANEAPKACRNIIGLALEGYYDNSPFHRIVPEFIIQTGDPTGTGMGGESFYGEPFPDEIHQRLRFTRRGIVACANSNEPGTNESQFFITLDSTPELQNKHTIFGRIEGPTIYNVLALADVEMRADEPDRPVYPPKLLTVEVLDNPFDDIVPRITREERKEQERAREEAARARRENRDGRKTKKNTALLSFGEAEEVAVDPAQKHTAKSSHDLLNDKRLKRETAAATPAIDIPVPPSSSSSSSKKGKAGIDEEDASEGPKAKKRKTDDQSSMDDLAALRAAHASRSAKTGVTSQISDLEASLRDMSGAKSKAKAEAEAEAAKRKRANRGRELLEEARRQYMSGKGDGSSKGKKGKEKERERVGYGVSSGGAGPDEEDTLAAIRRFQEELRASEHQSSTSQNGSAAAAINQKQERAEEIQQEEDVSALDREYGASDDDDDDDDWRNHRLDAGGTVLVTAKTKGAGGDSLDDYEVLDPRQPSAAAARLGFGAADSIARAKEEQRRAEGRKGRDFIDERDWKSFSSSSSSSRRREDDGGRSRRRDEEGRDGRGGGSKRDHGGDSRGYDRGEAKRPREGSGYDGRSGFHADPLADRSRHGGHRR
ncbi:Peptidyl-prolyl isomerase cwc27 [Tilletia horrida]|nr:Peptidyl-prolyl isomerase cwc27 [Tilletia horrida]